MVFDDLKDTIPGFGGRYYSSGGNNTTNKNNAFTSNYSYSYDRLPDQRNSSSMSSSNLEDGQRFVTLEAIQEERTRAQSRIVTKISFLVGAVAFLGVLFVAINKIDLSPGSSNFNQNKGGGNSLSDSNTNKFENIYSSSEEVRRAHHKMVSEEANKFKQIKDVVTDNSKHYNSIIRTGSTDMDITVTNEYGEYSAYARAMYSIDHLIEPFKPTVITVSNYPSNVDQFYWKLSSVDRVTREEDGKDIAYEGSGPSEFIEVQLSSPGKVYKLVVIAWDKEKNTLASYQTMNVISKKVRRELRQLTKKDRDEYFDAIETLYRTEDSEGKALYGDSYIGYQQFIALHDTTKYCYHYGRMFLTSHMAFTLAMEKSLQLINANITQPYWDFMTDTALYGKKWYQSDIWTNDYYGPIDTDGNNQHRVKEGRFADLPTLYDPDGTLYSEYAADTNPYGYVNHPHNVAYTDVLMRSREMCGINIEESFASCDSFISCFEDYNSLTAWESCMEYKVHTNMHGWLGGAWDCGVNLADFQKEYPQFSTNLLSFLGSVAHDVWFDYNTDIMDYYDCPSSCSSDDTESCVCTSTLDWDSLTDDEIYSYLEETLESVYQKAYNANFFIRKNSTSGRWHFVGDSGLLTHEDNLLLMRAAGKLFGVPGKSGHMALGASSNDPIFWALHPIFEKAWHVLLLSTPYSNGTFDMEWTAETCSGSAWNDTLPFSKSMLLSGHEETDYLTNRELWYFFEPGNTELPYLYDQFTTWGGCDHWNPCPECDNSE